MRTTHSIAVLLLAATAAAQTPAPPTTQQKPAGAVAPAPAADELDGLKASWESALAAQRAAPDAATLKTAREEIFRRAQSLMQKDPRSDLAVRTRVWLVSNRFDPKSQEQLIEELVTKDLASPALAVLADVLASGGSERGREYAETLFEKSPDRTVRGRALWAIASNLKRDYKRVLEAESKPEEASILFDGEPASRIDALRKTGSAELRKQYLASMKRIAAEFADVPTSRGKPIGPYAEGAIFELENLSIGAIAPVIEGEDIDGVPFKTSDYRGKVVVLDFWGNW